MVKLGGSRIQAEGEGFVFSSPLVGNDIVLGVGWKYNDSYLEVYLDPKQQDELIELLLTYSPTRRSGFLLSVLRFFKPFSRRKGRLML